VVADHAPGLDSPRERAPLSIAGVNE
jgi:hypothetical protein